MIKICFRFDDPSEVSDHELEKKIVEVFVKHDAKICFAVIPFKKKGDKLWPLTASNVQHIIDGVHNNTIEVAQHGYSHIIEKKTDKGYATEFSGVSNECQATKILEGKAHLSTVFQVPINGFVPPFNTYDTYTSNILSENNYKYISAGWDTCITNSYQNNILIFPRTCTLRTAHDALNEAERYKNLSPIINIVLHHDDFEEFIFAHNSQDHPPFTNLKELELLLNTIKANVGMEICSINSICTTHKELQSLRHISYRKWAEQLHWRVKSYFPRQLILTCAKRKVVFELVKGLTKRHT